MESQVTSCTFGEDTRQRALVFKSLESQRMFVPQSKYWCWVWIKDTEKKDVLQMGCYTTVWGNLPSWGPVTFTFLLSICFPPICTCNASLAWGTGLLHHQTFRSFLLFWDRGSGSLASNCSLEDGLELMIFLFAHWVLGLQACVIMPDFMWSREQISRYIAF